MKIKIDVTKQCIKKGIQDCYDRCAVALAIDKANELFTQIMVDDEYISFLFDKKEYAAKATKKLSKFINQFDENKSKCIPQSFTLIAKEI